MTVSGTFALPRILSIMARLYRSTSDWRATAAASRALSASRRARSSSSRFFWSSRFLRASSVFCFSRFSRSAFSSFSRFSFSRFSRSSFCAIAGSGLGGVAFSSGGGGSGFAGSGFGGSGLGWTALPGHAEEDEGEEGGVDRDREEERADPPWLAGLLQRGSVRRFPLHCAGRASNPTRFTWLFCSRSRTLRTSS